MTKKEMLPYEDARKFVRSLGLKNGKEWEQYVRTNRALGIPARPREYYKEWTDLYDWLGVSDKEITHLDVIQAMANCGSYQRAAKQLNVVFHTVRYHVAEALRLTGIHDIVNLIDNYYKQGLITIPQPDIPIDLSQLTKQQASTCYHMWNCMLNKKEVAEKMGITPNGLQNHLRLIYDKYTLYDKIDFYVALRGIKENEWKKYELTLAL
jgi:hypothetical protein